MQNVNKVLYTQDQSQVFSEAQKTVARNNIGAQAALTAGSNITIGSDNVISSTDTKYTAGDNVQISQENVISATDTKYTAGTNVQINSSNVISATDTTYTAGENIQIDSNHVINATTVFQSWTFRERTATITAQDLTNGYIDFTYVLGDEGVVVARRPNIIAMKGYDIESSNQLNGRTLSFLIVPHGGGVSVLMDSGFQLYTESVVNNYPWKAFKAVGLTMGNNAGKYDAVLRVSLDGSEPVGGTISTNGRLAVTLVGLVN